ncbi:hypothetical protein GCM10019016_123480 [Streptomyces prasinosporus]|uniref:Thioesterase domain-containing protein n=1 Tax=Streptomyces prasinosporus TaxID=68256 RepID=A0ABP6UE94_9ACTN
MAKVGKDPWIRPLRGAADVRARVVFFPHAGGAASFCTPFARRFPDGYDVAAAQYPGRQERREEPFVTTVEGLADRLLPSLRREEHRVHRADGRALGFRHQGRHRHRRPAPRR